MTFSKENFVYYSESVFKYLVISLAFLTPLFVLPMPWAQVGQSKALLLSGVLILALIAWLVVSIVSRRLVYSFDPILLVSLSIPVIYILSSALSGNFSGLVSGDALPGTFANVVMLFGVVLLSALRVRGDRRASVTLLLAVLCSSAVVFAFQLVRIVMPGALSLNGLLQTNTSSIVGSWHDFAIFAGLALLSSAALLETSLASTKIRTYALMAVMIAAAGILFVINFSDTWLAVGGGALLFAVFRAMRSYRRQKNVAAALRFAIFWFALVVGALVLGFTGTFLYSHLPTSMQLMQVEVRPSWQGTFTVGQHIFEGGKTLLFGSGPNTFDQQWAKFKPVEVNATNFWNVDFQSGIGVVPTALITVGVLGVLCWILLILALLWGGYRTLVEEPDARLRAMLFILSSFLMAFHVIYVPGMGISIILFLMLGMLAGLNTSSWRALEFSVTPKYLIASTLVAFVVLGTMVSTLLETRAVVSTLYTYRAADVYKRTGDIQTATALVATGVRIDPKNDIAQRAAVEVGLLQFAQQAKNQSGPDARGALQKTLSDTISHGLAAVSIDDSNYQNWLSLAGLYQSLAGIGIQGAYEQARAAYLRAASTTPTNPLPFVQLGQITLSQGKSAEAKGYFDSAIQLKPNLALPYYYRSQIRASEGDMQNAAQDALAAAQIANQDPLSWYNLGVILYLANDFVNAGIAFEKAVSLQNQYSDALFALAVVYDKVGAHDKALSAAQAVLANNPGNAIVGRVVQNLSAGKPALDGLDTTQAASASAKK